MAGWTAATGTPAAAGRVPGQDLKAIRCIRDLGLLGLERDGRNDVFRDVLGSMMALTSSDAGSLHVIDANRDELLLVAGKALHPRSTARWARLPLASKHPLARSVRSRRRSIVTEIASLDRTDGTPDQEGFGWSGIRARVHRPLLSRTGQPVGLISAYWGSVHTPDERELLLLDIAARHAADVIDHGRAEERLRAAQRVKDEFLGLVSHELRTPLTVIVGMSRVISASRLDRATVTSLARDIADSAEDLSEYVESMLVITRLEHELMPLPEPLLLHQLAGEVLARKRQLDASRRYVLRQAAERDVVDAQPELLRRVVANLVTNAAKYSQPGGPIMLSIEDGPEDGPEDAVVLRVLDRGPGLSDAQVERVFEPFYRAAESSWPAPGVGLGLAMCKRVIEGLGGRIWAYRREEGGMEFGFSLPRLPALEEA